MDDYGNTYVVGHENQNSPTFAGPNGREFGPLQGSANGPFVLKYSNEGQLVWRHPFPISGDNSFILVGAAAQLTAEAVIVAGWLRGSVTLDDGTTLTSATSAQFGGPEQNLVLLAIDIAGNVVWSRVYSSPSFVEPERVFVTATGDIEVVGRATDNATVGGASICCRNSEFGTNTFLARYSPTGDHIWSTGITGGDFFFRGAGADADGGMVVGGGLIGTMTFDGQTFTGGGDIFEQGLRFSAGIVLRTDPQGHLSWIRVYQGPDQSTSQFNPSLDAAGNVVMFGTFEGTLDLGNQLVLEHSGATVLQSTGVLAKLAPDGGALWAHQFPAQGFDFVDGRAIAADRGRQHRARRRHGGRAVAGWSAAGAGRRRRSFRREIRSGRRLALESRVHRGDRQRGRRPLRAWLRPLGRVRVAGEFDNTVDFGTGPLTAPGQPTSGGGSAFPRVPDDIYLLKLAP